MIDSRQPLRRMPVADEATHEQHGNVHAVQLVDQVTGEPSGWWRCWKRYEDGKLYVDVTDEFREDAVDPWAYVEAELDEHAARRSGRPA